MFCVVNEHRELVSDENQSNRGLLQLESFMNDERCSRQVQEAGTGGVAWLRQLLLFQQAGLPYLVTGHQTPDEPTMKADHGDATRTSSAVEDRLPPYWIQSTNNIPWPFIPQVGMPITFAFMV